MSLLKFLSSAKVEEVNAPARKAGPGVKKQRTPTTTEPAIRLLSDGSVYPNQAAIDKFDLEYRKGTPVKTEIPNKIIDAAVKNAPEGAVTAEPVYKITWEFENGEGNGFDVIDSRLWAQFKGEGSLLFISPVPRSEPKVDLFSIIRRDATTGEPTTSVLEQGSNTFGAENLVPAVQEIYDVKFTEEHDWVDLLILDEVEGTNVTEVFSTPVSLFPKKVSRGKDAGKADYERRDNAKIYAFVPFEVIYPIPAQEVVLEA